MNLLISSSQNPYMNLATEEYLLKNSEEDYIFLYVNKPCVVVGKHQITQKEINSRFIYDSKILIARRLSGGGAVYHDEGNLNFSFIRSVAFGENVSYQSITQSIFEYLTQLVPSISLSERNDFLLEGKKISGSAMHVYKNRVMAHCTLLIHCNLTNLSTSLKSHPNRYQDKSIPSVRSKVDNLSSAIENITVNSLRKDFSGYIKHNHLNVKQISLTEDAEKAISLLATGKYSLSTWIFGYSPKYTYTNFFSYENKNIHYRLDIEKGIIEKLIVESTDELNSDIGLKLKSLEGKHHNIFALSEWLNAQDHSSAYRSLLNSLF